MPWWIGLYNIGIKLLGFAVDEGIEDAKKAREDEKELPDKDQFHIKKQIDSSISHKVKPKGSKP